MLATKSESGPRLARPGRQEFLICPLVAGTRPLEAGTRLGMTAWPNPDFR
jgi:hypothetical protein